MVLEQLTDERRVKRKEKEEKQKKKKHKEKLYPKKPRV